MLRKTAGRLAKVGANKNCRGYPTEPIKHLSPLLGTKRCIWPSGQELGSLVHYVSYNIVAKSPVHVQKWARYFRLEGKR
jgi:hypothetical protein